MKTNKIVLLLCSVLLLLTSAFAIERSVVRIQGKIDEIDLKKHRMVVNERVFIWDTNTMFYSENSSRITADKLKRNIWVYIEGIRNPDTKQITIEKIYHLPRYIERGEQSLYPFIR